MEVFLVGVLLVATGLLVATAGYPLFRLMLPIMGFFAGFSIGFSVIQAAVGANAFSFVAAFLTALVMGMVFAVLSYTYYTLGVLLVAASFMAGVFAYFGQAIGLREDGFIIGLLAIAGGVIGVITVLRYGLQHDFIVVLTAMFGIGMIFAGAFLMFGDLTLSELHRDGVAQSIAGVVSSSWIWLIAWIGGTVLAAQTQIIMIARAIFGDQFVIEATKKK